MVLIGLIDFVILVVFCYIADDYSMSWLDSLIEHEEKLPKLV